jgi:type III pantothenate kinase
MSDHPFIAADVGNARIKLGLFAGRSAETLPEPGRTLSLSVKEPEIGQIGPWLADAAGVKLAWSVASVNGPAAERLTGWLRAHRPADSVTLLTCGDLPLEVRLPRPDLVGIDRLVNAVAVNRLREPDRPAIIVDAGSAITVDLVSADGAFLGGAILPGIEMSARALHKFTDRLQPVDVSRLTTPPPALGTDTVSAIRSGVFWGAVGAIRQLIARQCESGGNSRAEGWGGSSTAAPTDVFLTGGAGATMAELLSPRVRCFPNLTLSGIALAAQTS